MKATFLKLVAPFLFVVMAAVGGTAVAATGSPFQGAGTLSQAPEAPVDCKKTPDHPRCPK